MRIVSVNSTTATQPVFMTCPGSVNVLSMGNTLRYITFFSALKEFTSCHNMAGAKKSYGSTLYHAYKRTKERTYVPAYICTYTHTHTHTYTRVTAHRPTGTHVHSFIHTSTYIDTLTHTHTLPTRVTTSIKIIRNSVLT